MAWNGERVELRRWGQNNLIVANPYFAKKKKNKGKKEGENKQSNHKIS